MDNLKNKEWLIEQIHNLDIDRTIYLQALKNELTARARNEALVNRIIQKLSQVIYEKNTLSEEYQNLIKENS